MGIESISPHASLVRPYFFGCSDELLLQDGKASLLRVQALMLNYNANWQVVYFQQMPDEGGTADRCVEWGLPVTERYVARACSKTALQYAVHNCAFTYMPEFLKAYGIIPPIAQPPSPEKACELFQFYASTGVAFSRENYGQLLR